MEHHGIPQPSKKVITRHVYDPVKTWFDNLFKKELQSLIKQSKINNTDHIIKKSKLNNKNKI